MRTLLRAAGLAAVSLTLAVAPSRAGVPSEKALPANTVAFFKVDSATKLREAFNASQFGQMLADPAMKPFLDDAQAKLEEPSKKLKEAVGVSIGELLKLPQGAVTVAVVTRDNDKLPVALLVSADAGSNEAKMLEVLERVTKEAEKNGAKVTTEDYKGLKLTSIKSSNESSKDEPPGIWTKQGSVFHMATDAEALKDVLGHAEGRTESLASNENYTGAQKGMGKGIQASLYVDLGQLIDLGIQAAAKNGAGNADQVKAMLQILGVNNLKSAALGLGFDVDGYDTMTRMFVYSPGPAQGVLKLFAMPAIDLKPQAWVPASVASYQSISFDFDAFWNGLNELVDMLSPGRSTTCRSRCPATSTSRRTSSGPWGTGSPSSATSRSRSPRRASG